MSRSIRKIQLLLTSRFKEPITSMDTTVEHSFRVSPLDLDENLHMNNARFLQYMELGRWDMMVRTGFLRYALKNKIAVPVANQIIAYRRPLRLLQSFKVTTRILAWDKRRIYFEHTMTRAGELCAKCLVEGRLIGDRELTLAEIVRILKIDPGPNFERDDDTARLASELAKKFYSLIRFECAP